MLDSFSQGDTRGRHVGLNIYHCGNIAFGHGWRIVIVSFWHPSCPAPSNKREAADACHGNLTTLHGFAWGAFCGHDSFIGFNAIKFLQSENIFVLTEALRYHKQLSTSLIVVGDIIIGKSFDKLVKARGVKVSTKWWCDRWITGWSTGYASSRGTA